ncbi:hypothetical protein B4589_001865 [Halolamina sp. CBA1230]|uniref:DUF7547 family protein n=1 Tax=Halolamina sp. CBA1230 TaxID=1853690 RepID=UPI0009A150D3|nr:hypothetical protein [Halolamina sp. CBA1230]QKY19183.1 hypothetical protein B4589_001865 [Halolamina sp. CBA1230]
MTDRRDPSEEDLRARLDELESTLTELRDQLDAEPSRPTIPRGLPGSGRRPPRPPRLREVLRFTEEYTIPTLISILETNVRLLRLTGAALRALDPERSATPSDDGAVRRAIDAGRGLSTDRLASTLEELNDAIAGTEAPDPEARELLSEAEELSAEIQDRLRDATESADTRRERSGGAADGVEADDTVSIDVADAGEGENADEQSDGNPEPDVDAELDSIRDEIRGSEADEEVGDDDAGDGDEDEEPGDDADGTALE